jgi:hypothetical protein
MNDTTGPCAECGEEIDYRRSHTVTKDGKRRHSGCTKIHHWMDEGADYAGEAINDG